MVRRSTDWGTMGTLRPPIYTARPQISDRRLLLGLVLYTHSAHYSTHSFETKMRAFSVSQTVIFRLKNRCSENPQTSKQIRKNHLVFRAIISLNRSQLFKWSNSKQFTNICIFWNMLNLSIHYFKLVKKNQIFRSWLRSTIYDTSHFCMLIILKCVRSLYVHINYLLIGFHTNYIFLSKSDWFFF